MCFVFSVVAHVNVTVKNQLVSLSWRRHPFSRLLSFVCCLWPCYWSCPFPPRPNKRLVFLNKGETHKKGSQEEPREKRNSNHEKIFNPPFSTTFFWISPSNKGQSRGSQGVVYANEPRLNPTLNLRLISWYHSFINSKYVNFSRDLEEFCFLRCFKCRCTDRPLRFNSETLQYANVPRRMRENRETEYWIVRFRYGEFNQSIWLWIIYWALRWYALHSRRECKTTYHWIISGWNTGSGSQLLWQSSYFKLSISYCELSVKWKKRSRDSTWIEPITFSLNFYFSTEKLWIKPVIFSTKFLFSNVEIFKIL